MVPPSMRLVLYSGGTGSQNQAMAEEVRALLREQRNPVITFVPSSEEDADCDFRDFQRQLSSCGVSRFRCVAIDKELSIADEKTLFGGDAIFLGGGNTFYFLHHLRERRLVQKFRAFVRRGGL